MKAVSALLALILITAPLRAAPNPQETLAGLQAMDVALARVGFRLVTANVALCDRRQPASGMLIHGIEQYGSAFRTAAAALFTLGAAPGVEAILPGTPADRAGIRAGDAIIAINGTVSPQSTAAGFDRMAAVYDRMEQALASGPVQLDLIRGGQPIAITIEGAPACASRFQVKPATSLSAGADGRYVEIDAGLMAYADNEDEIAVIAAHELAHNILKHRAALKGVGKGISGKIGKGAARIRETEIAADRFSIRLLANAGYPLEAAPAFWTRFGKQHGHGVLSDSTHLRWKKRVALIEAEIAAVRTGR